MKVYLEVYGCTANKSDASLIQGLLNKKGYQFVKNIDNADMVIILTCTVIGTTEQRMLSRLRKLKKSRKKIVVSGCMASIQADLIKSILPDAKILPPRYVHQILNIIDNKELLYNEKKGPKFFDNISAPIIISEGCQFSCSYCITSPARGDLTSYPKERIIEDVHCAIKQGCKEIQLTAQDTASYGDDTGQNLGELLSTICKIEDEFKIRVGMMNPYTALKNIDSIIKGYNHKKIYKFLHLPVQSGDDDILHIMDRKYNVNDFLKIIKLFRNNYPEITLSTDIIVGFPTETDEQFNRSIDLLIKVKPDIVNITRYSPRPFTKAKTMNGLISTKIAKERSKYITNMSKEIIKEKNKNFIGNEYSVLITKKIKKSTFVGRSNNYKPIITNENVEIGKHYNFKIIDSDYVHLLGIQVSRMKLIEFQVHV